MSILLEGDRLKLNSSVLETSPSKHQMTVLSPVHLIVTGQGRGQIVALPSALTLTQGWVYYITNYGKEPIQVKDFLGAYIAQLNPDEKLELFLIENNSAQGRWATAQISISNNPIGNCLYSVNFEANGAAKGKWLNTHHSVDSSKIPALVPFELCKLVSISFANLQDKVSSDILLYKNGTSNINLCYTANVREQKLCTFSIENELLFRKKDSLSVYISACQNSFSADSPLTTFFFKVLRA